MEQNAISVKQLNTYVKSLIEGDPRLSCVFVRGEISNFKNHYASGHLYFTLKDSEAAIRCVMFRSYASAVKFIPEDGVQVIIKGRVSLYERDGGYQLYAEEMISDGIGDISFKFEQIKEKLSKEGLFDESGKRSLPKFPQNIAVITSDTGAAVKDIINITSRRYPVCRIILCPVAVQGEKAVPDMLNALDRVYCLENIDLIIIGRGGGSIEDLWAFNSEELARKIYQSPIPVISAVGHETDFTICDFVADKRAPTPSAAAELAVPDMRELKSRILKYEDYLKTALSSKYKVAALKLDSLLKSVYISNPMKIFVYDNEQLLDRLTDRLVSSIELKTAEYENQLSKSISSLDALSPLKVMGRGFAAVLKKGKTVKSIKDIEKGDELKLRLKDGIALCDIKGKE
ncbi:MAG: exodeoxyribonuclease VII large subunit [Clostridia bacterium]|nr:exodeoxyribonuclease VII large subunit [Clostridia bacterium]